MQSLLKRIKYDGNQEVASFISSYLVKIFSSFPFPSIDFCFPVPIHSSKERSRGGNQVTWLFDFMKHSYDMNLNGVYRCINSSPLYDYSSKERKEILKDVFEFDSSISLSGKSVLILDDIFTTGATLSTLASLCRDKGAKDVYGLVLSYPSIYSS